MNSTRRPARGSTRRWRSRRRRRGGARGGRVAGRAHDDGARAPLGAERVLEELDHLATTLADERDDDDVGLGLARDLPHQRRLADARAGEQADALPLADGEQPVEDAHAERQRAGDAPAGEGIGRGAIDRPRLGAGDRAAAVDRAAEAVEHAPEQAFGDARSRTAGRWASPASRGRCRSSRRAASARPRRRGSRPPPRPAARSRTERDLHQLADAHAGDDGADDEAGHLGDPPRFAARGGPLEPRERLPEIELSHETPPPSARSSAASWVSRRASTRPCGVSITQPYRPTAWSATSSIAGRGGRAGGERVPPRGRGRDVVGMQAHRHDAAARPAGLERGPRDLRHDARARGRPRVPTIFSAIFTASVIAAGVAPSSARAASTRASAQRGRELGQPFLAPLGAPFLAPGAPRLRAGGVGVRADRVRLGARARRAAPRASARASSTTAGTTCPNPLTTRPTSERLPPAPATSSNLRPRAAGRRWATATIADSPSSARSAQSARTPSCQAVSPCAGALAALDQQARLFARLGRPGGGRRLHDAAPPSRSPSAAAARATTAPGAPRSDVPSVSAPRASIAATSAAGVSASSARDARARRRPGPGERNQTRRTRSVAARPRRRRRSRARGALALLASPRAAPRRRRDGPRRGGRP